MQGRLQVYVTDNSIMEDIQHGFRSTKGATTAIAIAHETKGSVTQVELSPPIYTSRNQNIISLTSADPS